MKKVFVILSFSCFVIACGGNDANTPKEERKEEAEQVAEVTKPKSEDYTKGLELVAKSDCFTCHKVKEAAVGPAYEAVAAKYELNDAVVDSLAHKIIKGGAGNWGSVPMTPHPQVTLEDAKTMVKYVLALKK